MLMIEVEQFVDRSDDLQEAMGNRSVVLHPLQDIFINDGYMQNHNYMTNPISFNIVSQFTWQPYLLLTTSDCRPVPTVLETESGDLPPVMFPRTGITTEALNSPPVFDPGRIDVFCPNNILLGGQILNSDGYEYKIDYEVCSVVLEIPNSVLGTEQIINVFSYFVYDSSGNNSGITYLGFPAMRFSDQTFVQPNALELNQVQFYVALESLSPNINGVYNFPPDGYGAIVDGIYGVSINSQGVLRLNFANLYSDPTLLSLQTRVRVEVHLKKSGFNNTPLVINTAQMQNILSLIPPS
jgi:hypothetical protein